MYENIIRGGFSSLAAAVTLAMAQEWFTWATEERVVWKFAPAVVLAAFSVYEAHKVWNRFESALGL